VKAEAKPRFHKLMLAAKGETDGDKNACFGVLNAYMAWVKARRKVSTYPT
jgi:hypothetical protein